MQVKGMSSIVISLYTYLYTKKTISILIWFFEFEFEVKLSLTLTNLLKTISSTLAFVPKEKSLRGLDLISN